MTPSTQNTKPFIRNTHRGPLSDAQRLMRWCIARSWREFKLSGRTQYPIARGHIPRNILRLWRAITAVRFVEPDLIEFLAGELARGASPYLSRPQHRAPFSRLQENDRP